MESAAAFAWNRWQACYGISGSFRVERVAALPWNQWQDSPGIGGSFAVEYAPALGGLVIFSLNRGEVQTARELGEQMLSLAQRVHDPAGLANAHISLGNALYNLRAWDAARTHLEQGIAF